MDIIKTGIGLTKTIKNVTRFREIVSVLARNGFDELILKSGLNTLVPDFVLPKSRYKKITEERGETGDWWEVIGFRLRKSFEELGPGFVKIGQLLSTREDMLDVAFINEMKKLRDSVKPCPYEKSLQKIESALGNKWNEVFEELDSNPIGTASIGTVYKGKLKTGESVVVKVRRPDIEHSIEVDFGILEFIISKVERISKEIQYMGISKMVHDFGITLKNELDFRSEAKNADRLREIITRLDENKIFYVPKMYHQYVREEVLVMEYVAGIPFTESAKIKPHLDVVHNKLEQGLSVFVNSLLAEGFFHADLHGGNFFLQDDHTIAIIDFGLVGSISKKNRVNLIAILYALLTHNYENLVYEFMDVAEYESVPDIEALIRDVRDSLSPFVGLTVQEMNLSLLLRRITKVLSNHQLYLPREWFIVFRALMTLDGVGKSLGLDFDIFGIVEKDIKGIIKSFVTVENAAEETVWAARDTFSSLRVIPRHLRWALKEIRKRKYAIEVINRGYSEDIRFLGKAILFLSFNFITCALILGGTLFVINTPPTDIYSVPIISWIFWGMSFLMFIQSLVFLRLAK